MKDLYRNPFSGINAVTLDDQSILDYWCSPFPYNIFTEIKETDIYEDPNNIVLLGGRSTGKTMFLRYWSVNVQLKLAIQQQTDNAVGILDYLKQKKGLGFYIRIDGPVLRSFTGSGLTETEWNAIFIHYFELVVARNYLEALRDLQDLNQIAHNDISNNFLPKLASLIGCEKLANVEDAVAEINTKIIEVDQFRGNVPFKKMSFSPAKGFASQSLSFGIPDLIKKTILDLKKGINFILLIDEYENFLEPQQRVINTLLKFSRTEIKFRVGMRLEGFRTYNMISSDDFIKEGREYRTVVFDEVVIREKGKAYSNFLKEICKRRLESVEILKKTGRLDISAYLTASEDLDDEALRVVTKKNERHFDHFKDVLRNVDLNLIRYPENALLELLNVIWIMRGNEPKVVGKAMNDYLIGKKNQMSKKYEMDYIHKYKLSLMFLLCSIYRKNKEYYSFNTFKYLSSGIIGNFIELCRRAFQYAEFEDKDLLIKEAKITVHQQTRAALDFSQSELQQLNRIEAFGGQIYRFVNNLGNIFRDFHKDEKMRYPETNQFSIDINNIQDPAMRNAFRAAIRWSAIQRKPNLQQTSPGQHLKDIYTINRIYSPAFQISYRTRGGHSIKLSNQDIIDLMSEEEVKSKKFLSTAKPKAQNSKPKAGPNNLSLFEPES